MMNIFRKLKMRTMFSSSEVAVADYIIEHPEQVMNMSVKELSQAAHASLSTIYRLCDKLEVNGFSALKVEVSRSLEDFSRVDDEFDFNFPIKSHSTYAQMLARLKHDYEQTILSTYNLFDLEELRLVAQHMRRASKIDVFTSAGNVFLADNFRFQMQEIGVDVNVPREDYELKLTAARTDKTHLAIVISFGGRWGGLKRIMEILKEQNCPVVLITSTEFDFRSFPADYHLYISSYENHYKKISSYSTRLSVLFILDMLYTGFFNLDYDRNLQTKLDYYKKLSGHV